MENCKRYVFISYSWDNDDHKAWVRDLADRLEADNVFVIADFLSVDPGTELTRFMESAVSRASVILPVLTPRYKDRADAREGGVGYEARIITGVILNRQDAIQIVPILRRGEPAESLPSWIGSSFFLDFRGDSFNERAYRSLIDKVKAEAHSVLRQRETNSEPSNDRVNTQLSSTSGAKDFIPIDIIRVSVDSISPHSIDGGRGSGLYRIPFLLSAVPTNEWVESFIRKWNRPSSFSSMHRPGIASVDGNLIWLSGTTLEEVERHHRRTLIQAVKEANDYLKSVLQQQSDNAKMQNDALAESRARIHEASKRISFD
jgi:hypothetical protein